MGQDFAWCKTKEKVLCNDVSYANCPWWVTTNERQPRANRGRLTVNRRLLIANRQPHVVIPFSGPAHAPWLCNLLG
jgi:hypothetical protein